MFAGTRNWEWQMVQVPRRRSQVTQIFSKIMAFILITSAFVKP